MAERKWKLHWTFDVPGTEDIDLCDHLGKTPEEVEAMTDAEALEAASEAAHELALNFVDSWATMGHEEDSDDNS